MPNITRRTVLAALAAVPGVARAEEWAPRRPIRIVVPFTPGQANDIAAHILANRASEQSWPQHRVVVENRAGAGGAIGMEAVAAAAPDGHTLAFGSLATFAINPAIAPAIPYDIERDFLPVLRVFEGTLLVVVPAASGITDLTGLVRRIKAGSLTFASSGPGSTQHMGAELLLQRLGARATHVPYRGSAAAMTDLASGTVDFALESATGAMPLVRSGLLKALAITAAARLPEFDLPTVAEAAGLPGYAVSGTGGLLAPARTPAAAVAALAEGFAAAMATPALQARFRDAGLAPMAEGPSAFGRFIKAELEKWREVARRGDIRLE